MVLRYESADPDHSAFDLGDQAVFIVGIGQNPRDVSLGNRQRRLGFDDFHRVVLGGDFADGCLMDLEEGSRVVGAHLSDGEGLSSAIGRLGSSLLARRRLWSPQRATEATYGSSSLSQ
jgi:hypothetical protein